MNAKIKRFIVIAGLAALSVAGVAETIVMTTAADAANKPKLVLSHNCSNAHLMTGEKNRAC